MQKILLIGELEEIIRSVNECLENDFQVQICSEKIDMVRGMAKIVKPDMIIVCQIGIDELNYTIFTWVKEQMPKTPVLIISTKESWGSISGYCTTPQFEKLFRPVTGSVIVETCKNMLACGKDLSLEKEELTKDVDDTQQAPLIMDKKHKGRERIMIVDDNPLVLRNMKSILEEKYDIFLVPSGEKALELIPKKHPDLVLLDYEMPGMDGKAVFEAMNQDDEMKTIPVIFLTSMAQREQVYGVLKFAPAGYILKPAHRERLMDEIAKVLS